MATKKMIIQFEYIYIYICVCVYIHFLMGIDESS